MIGAHQEDELKLNANLLPSKVVPLKREMWPIRQLPGFPPTRQPSPLVRM